MKKLNQLSEERLTGAVYAIIANYEMAFNDIDKDKRLYVSVENYDKHYTIIFHYVSEYKSIGDTGDSYNESWSRKKLVMDKEDTLVDLFLDCEKVIREVNEAELLQL